MADQTSLIQQVAPGSNALDRVNENFDAASPALMYGRDARTTAGSTWGYIGGRWGGVLIPNGTLTISVPGTYHIVASRSNGAVSFSDTVTNWNDSTNYVRLYRVEKGPSSFTGYEDHRQAFGGSGGGGGGSAAGVSYDNTASGLAASNVQAAVDELAARGGGGSGNATLSDDAASTTLPATGASTPVQTLLQSLRNNVKAVFTGAFFSGASSKGVPVDADSLPLVNSASGNDIFRLTFANLWLWVLAKLAALGIGTTFATYGGTANAITLSSSTARTAYPRGTAIAFRAAAVNTGAATINLDGLGAVAAVTVTGAALPAGYIRTDVDTFATYNGTAWVVSRETEYGVNSNGRFVRHANGSLQIWGQVTLPAQAMSTQATVTWTYPATMIAGEAASISAFSQSSGGSYDAIGLAMLNGVYVGTMNTTSLTVTSYSYRNATTGPVVFAVQRSGNWY